MKAIDVLRNICGQPTCEDIYLKWAHIDIVGVCIIS